MINKYRVHEVAKDFDILFKCKKKTCIAARATVHAHTHMLVMAHVSAS